MTDSGRVLEWPDLGRPILDKHSTGGVGDKVSLVLAPIMAACGAAVPMISGRGLGHTGGTLDKLDAIPGYDTTPGIDAFRRIVADAGCAIVGPTDDLAPADRRLYAIRDVTATIDSVPLITASILSKKLAAGLDGLVMDVKVGNGAFMTGMDAARELAHSIVTTAQGAGLPARAVITDMNQVLGDNVGNALEVGEAVDYLTGLRRESRLHEVVTALCRELLLLGGLAEDATGSASRHREGARQRRGGGVFPAHGRRIGRPGRLRRPSRASSVASNGGGAGDGGGGCLGRRHRDAGGGPGGARARGWAHAARSVDRPPRRVQRSRRTRRRSRRRAAVGAGPRTHGGRGGRSRGRAAIRLQAGGQAAVAPGIHHSIRNSRAWYREHETDESGRAACTLRNPAPTMRPGPISGRTLKARCRPTP